MHQDLKSEDTRLEELQHQVANAELALAERDESTKGPRMQVRISGGESGWVNLKDSDGKLTVSSVRNAYISNSSVAVTNDFDVRRGEIIRKIPAGMVLEGLDGPHMDDSLNLTRLKCRLVEDGSQGWITTRGNQGTPYITRLPDGHVVLQQVQLHPKFPGRQSKVRMLEVGTPLEVLEHASPEKNRGSLTQAKRTRCWAIGTPVKTGSAEVLLEEVIPTGDAAPKSKSASSGGKKPLVPPPSKKAMTGGGVSKASLPLPPSKKSGGVSVSKSSLPSPPKRAAESNEWTASTPVAGVGHYEVPRGMVVKGGTGDSERGTTPKGLGLAKPKTFLPPPPPKGGAGVTITVAKASFPPPPPPPMSPFDIGTAQGAASMDMERLKHLTVQLEKSLQDEATATRILGQLEAVEMTSNLINNTRVGQVTRNIANTHTSEAVRQRAKTLRHRWKKLLLGGQKNE